MGVHCQMSMSIVVHSADVSPASHGWDGMPNQPRTWLARPMFGSKMSRNIMPTATGVATSGMRIATRTHFSPRNGRHRSRAMAMPRTTSTMRTTPVNCTVRQTAGQNRAVSLRTSR